MFNESGGSTAAPKRFCEALQGTAALDSCQLQEVGSSHIGLAKAGLMFGLIALCMVRDPSKPDVSKVLSASRFVLHPLNSLGLHLWLCVNAGILARWGKEQA